MVRRRLWLWGPLGLGAALVAVVWVAAVALVAFPDSVRLTVVGALRAATGRPVVIEVLNVDPWTGNIALRGLKVTDHDGGTLATLEKLDARIRRRALLRLHISFASLAIDGSTVRVVRHEDGAFNIADLISKKPSSTPGFDVSVSDFRLERGTVLLEDRMLSPARTWRSEGIALRARNVSTRRGDGTGEASSLINGSPVSVKVEDLRLRPVHLRAVVHATDLDVALARVYLPEDLPVTLERGRLNLTVSVINDARDGLRLNADAAVADAVAIRVKQNDPFIRAPAIKLAVRDFTVSRQGAMAVGRVELDGGASVLHGDVNPPARFDFDRVRLSAEGLSWPVQGPARVSFASTVPGGGDLRADGVVRMKPAAADLDVRLSGLAIEPWARYVSSSAKATGVGEARLAVRANLEGALTASATGSVAVNRVVVTDGGRRLLATDRAEVSGIETGWPLRITLGRVRLVRPAVSLERNADGVIALPTRDAATRDQAGATRGEHAPSAAPAKAPPITVREVVVDDGALDWRDAAVKPAARLQVRAIDLAVQDVGWPLEKPAPVRLRLRSPGGGTLAVNGSASLEGADVRIRAQGVDLTPWRPYIPITATLGGNAHADVQARVTRADTVTAQVRGDAGLTRAYLDDGRRRIAAIERVQAYGLDVDWPGRVDVDSVTLRQPWLLVERDEKGALALTQLLRPAANGTGESASPSTNGTPGPRPTVAIKRLSIEDGGVRVADHSIDPPYSEDLKQAWIRVTGLSTASAPPATLQMRGILGTAGKLDVRGRIGALDGPIFVDATAQLRDFAIPRVNPYLQRFTAWTAKQGRLNTTITARVEGDALQARTETKLGGLQVVKTASDDAAEKRVGLPLGMIVALLKDRQGTITLALPVGGRLNDPRFDFQDAIWGAVRTIAVKTIALPVSWIGKLHLTRDSRIQDIEIDPLRFAVGGAELTREAAERVGRLADFMKHLPDVRMLVTPAVSLGDVEALKTEQIRARIRESVLQNKLSERAAAARIYTERFGREPFGDLAAIVTALREVEPPPEDAAFQLAKRRADAVREALKKVDVDPARLQLSKEPEALDTFDAGRVDFAVTDRIKQRRTLADMLRALMQALAEKLQALRR
jgi:uncharacterized protein involved in outer membrane biogenesis